MTKIINILNLTDKNIRDYVLFIIFKSIIIITTFNIRFEFKFLVNSIWIQILTESFSHFHILLTLFYYFYKFSVT